MLQSHQPPLTKPDWGMGVPLGASEGVADPLLTIAASLPRGRPLPCWRCLHIPTTAKLGGCSPPENDVESVTQAKGPGHQV